MLKLRLCADLTCPRHPGRKYPTMDCMCGFCVGLSSVAKRYRELEEKIDTGVSRWGQGPLVRPRALLWVSGTRPTTERRRRDPPAFSATARASDRVITAPYWRLLRLPAKPNVTFSLPAGSEPRSTARTAGATPGRPMQRADLASSPEPGASAQRAVE